MKTLKIILKIFISVFAISFFAISFNLNNKAFEVVATFLSITTGFSITALSIIATSPFSKNLYNQESSKNNSKTLLHELVDRFKTSMILFIATICLIVLLNLYPEKYIPTIFKVFETEITTMAILKSFVLYFSILSLISFVILFNTFSKFVIKSGKLIK
ncbi:hypothetical protein V5J73_02290 [Flavobacterium sp. KS-LB2]|jgi:hypothetical protein|uniref:Uncharacterized protein n=1 Tax=Flavobacterium petrolei TaxID=2259594 RepID=A0A482TXU0_9FLAO|nr:hypothetical protein [Flavobacterium petrolei]RYJ52804.1 hypothetical protein DR871_001785 [Flavobacterium petrolei]